MSGGRFDYLQYRFTEITDDIELEINNNNIKTEEWSDPNNFSEETIQEFKNAIIAIKKAQIYAQRVDWLLSGDDNESTFHNRLKEDLSKL